MLLSMVLQQKPPVFRIKKTRVEEREKAKIMSPEEIENIYKYDLFDTFRKKPFKPMQKALVTPTPRPKEIPPAKAPKLPKPEFIPSLKITLKGIVYAAEEEKSICIIEDEAKKENVYHVGDTIKDAQIIKIAQNRITILRVNGQHETIFLRKDDGKAGVKKVEWDGIIKKINDNNFGIDFVKFPQEITSLGSLTEKLSLITSYEKGKPIGIKILDVAPNSVGDALGLKKDDLIISINGIGTANRKDRIRIYDNVIGLKKGDSVSVSIKRNRTEVTIKYDLTDVEKAKKRIFVPDKKEAKKEEEKTTEEKLFKLSQLQEREKKRRKFDEKHRSRHKEVISEIRNRLLNNMKSKVRNSRARTRR